MTETSPIDRYVAFFETINPETLGELRALCSDDVHFIDPFNDVKGVDRVIHIFEKMYEDVDEPSFWVLQRAEDGSRIFLRWTFTGRAKRSGNTFEIDGVSEIQLNEDGKVILHRDFWDTAQAVYEKVPLLGSLLRVIRRRLSAD